MDLRDGLGRALAVGVLLCACADDDGTSGGAGGTGGTGAGASGGSTSSSGGAGSGGGSSAALAPIVATFVAHNEGAGDSPIQQCGTLHFSRDEYLAKRTVLLDVVEAILAGGGAFDLQTDLGFVQDVAEWEGDDAQGVAVRAARTEGKNLLAYLAGRDPVRVSVDAHSHERDGMNAPTYTYADVAFELGLLGVPDSGIVGGFTFATYSSGDGPGSCAFEETWSRFAAPVAGILHDTQWQPTILWGGGSPGHCVDSNASGVWRPLAPTVDEFFVDDPAQVLVNVGTFDSESPESSATGVVSGDAIQTLLDARAAGALEAGRVYTVSVMMQQCSLTADAPAAVAAILERYQGAVDAGELEWATVPQIAARWRASAAPPTTPVCDGGGQLSACGGS